MEMERPPTLQTFPETFGAGERRCLLWNGRCTPMACSNSSSQARRRNQAVRVCAYSCTVSGPGGPADMTHPLAGRISGSLRALRGPKHAKGATPGS
jgi:hypothetical protein